MKSYTTPWIRNVGIVGHGATGKTQLVSSLLSHCGNDHAVGESFRRQHSNRLGRRRNRPQNHHPIGAGVRGMGAAGTIRKNKN